MAKRKRGTGPKFVIVYEWEMQTAAYQTLSSDARSLLFEFRRAYNGQENRLIFSVRQMAERLGISTKPAQKARDELIERQWIRLITPGSFNRKVKHASVYALESEPIYGHDGDTAPKGYLSWQPPEQKSTVVSLTTDSGQFDHRGIRESA